MNARQMAAAVWLAMTACGAATAAELAVGAGQVLTIGPAQASLQLDRLVLGDKAVVRFAPGVTQWRVDAREVTIGRDVLIDGRGAPGVAGAAAGPASSGAATCEDGRDGQAGGDGGAGAAGVDMQLRLGIRSIDSLRVMADGGMGGSGGRGGAGQAGGARSGKCASPAGGDGGHGGHGGAGGNAGSIQISYFGMDGQDGFALRDNIAAQARGGAGGAGGDAGAGGAAAAGSAARTTNPIGTNVRIAGGRPGKAGASGPTGPAGQSGQVSVQEIAAVGTPTAVASPSPSGAGDLERMQRQLDQLTREVRDLANRLEAVEQGQ